MSELSDEACLSRPQCQLERREKKRKIRYGRDDFDLLRNLGQINH